MTFSSFFFKEYKKVRAAVTAVSQSSLGPRCFLTKQPRTMTNLWDLHFPQVTGAAQHKVTRRRMMMLMKRRLKMMTMMMMMYVWCINNSGAYLLITTWLLLLCSIILNTKDVDFFLLSFKFVVNYELLITYEHTVFGFSKRPSMSNIYNAKV